MSFAQLPIGSVTAKIEITNKKGDKFFPNARAALGNSINFNIDTDAIKMEISLDDGKTWYDPQTLVNGPDNTINLSLNGMIQNKDGKDFGGFMGILKNKGYFDIVAQFNADEIGEESEGCECCSNC